MAAEAQHDPPFSAAKQLYAEQFGDAIVTNTYLKIALLVMALVAAGLIYTNVKTVCMVENLPPSVPRPVASTPRSSALPCPRTY